MRELTGTETNLYDSATGAWIGVRDANGTAQYSGAPSYPTQTAAASAAASVAALVQGGGNPFFARNGSSSLLLRNAIARALSGQRSRILLNGDSTLVGAGAGTNGAGSTGLVGARAGNWATQLAARLTAMGIPAFNEAIIGNQNVNTDGGVTYSQYDPRLTVTGFTTDAIGCPGGKAWLSTASGSVWAFTPVMPFDRFDVLTASNNGNGSVTANVDGGATLATINTNAALNIQKTTVSCTRGTHTINLTTTSTANTYIIGVIPWDSTLGGIDLLQAGWWGGKAADLAQSSVGFHPNAAATLAALAPNYTINQITINDANDGTAAAAYLASITAMDTAQAAAGAGVMWMSGIPSGTPQSSDGTLAGIVAQVAALATTKSRPYADLCGRLVSYAALNGIGWMYDTKHGNRQLYADEALWLADLLTVQQRT